VVPTAKQLVLLPHATSSRWPWKSGFGVVVHAFPFQRSISGSWKPSFVFA
jgi:hypothetical protein